MRDLDATGGRSARAGHMVDARTEDLSRNNKGRPRTNSGDSQQTRRNSTIGQGEEEKMGISGAYRQIPRRQMGSENADGKE